MENSLIKSLNFKRLSNEPKIKRFIGINMRLQAMSSLLSLQGESQKCRILNAKIK